MMSTGDGWPTLVSYKTYFDIFSKIGFMNKESTHTKTQSREN